MKTLFFDLFSGISGDMTLGALLDLGVRFENLQNELKKLGVAGYHLHCARAKRFQIEGVQFNVHLENAEHSHSFNPLDPLHSHPHTHEHSHFELIPGLHEHTHTHGADEHRNFAQIRQIISASTLSDWVKQKAIAVFQRVADAEGKIHGVPSDKVHFHEVGAVDSIVDIVGTCIAFELLGKPRVLASSVIEGSGWVDCAHGRFPVPAPATMAILTARNVPLSQCEEPHELVTPTGAAIMAEFAEGFSPMQGLTPERVGYGIGSRENKTRPNVLRVVLGQTEQASTHDWESDTISVLETNLDNINSEILGAFVEKGLAAGALDVFYTPIEMKKNRPGVLLTVLCQEKDADHFSELILRETTAFGVRHTMAHRRKLAREIQKAATSFGEVEIKLGRLNGQIIQASPEFESCRKVAEQAHVPIKTVYVAAQAAFWQKNALKNS